MLEQEFLRCVSVAGQAPLLLQDRWLEIVTKHSDKKRYYHNLSHLENLLLQLQGVKNTIVHWDEIVFAIAYHDIVYDTLHTNNEEQSASLAQERLTAMRIDPEKIRRCTHYILATKKHAVSEDNDCNLFTDADLSILGTSSSDYALYASAIRKEYSWYPDLVYNPGRKKVLQHFLSMERIFKTDYFFKHYEQQARHNLQWELKSL